MEASCSKMKSGALSSHVADGGIHPTRAPTEAAPIAARQATQTRPAGNHQIGPRRVTVQSTMLATMAASKPTARIRPMSIAGRPTWFQQVRAHERTPPARVANATASLRAREQTRSLRSAITCAGPSRAGSRRLLRARSAGSNRSRPVRCGDSCAAGAAPRERVRQAWADGPEQRKMLHPSSRERLCASRTPRGLQVSRQITSSNAAGALRG